MCTELNTIVSNQLSEYKENHDETLLKQIIDNIRKLVYFMPYESLGIKEEECAEILLETDSRIMTLIGSYDPKYNDFAAFLYPTVIQQIKSIHRSRKIQQQRESSVIYNNSAYEFVLNESANSVESSFVSEPEIPFGSENVFYKRMMQAFKLSPRTRARFFLYFISYAVEMNESSVIRYCKAFHVNVKQTLEIIRYFQKSISEKEKTLKEKARQEIETALEKKNEYFARILYLENIRADLNFLSDHSKDERIESEINRLRTYYSSKDEIIKRGIKKIPRYMISGFFNIRDGSVAVYTSFCKNLIAWCLSPDSHPEITAKAAGMKDKAWACLCKKKNIKGSPARLEEFKPLDYFKTTISLNR